MKPCYIVAAPSKLVVAAYAKWKQTLGDPERTIMDDGWTLSSLKFAHLYEAQAAALDLAMVSGSVNPLQPHEIIITELV